MKKILSLVLAFCAMLVLTACSGQGESKPSDTSADSRGSEQQDVKSGTSSANKASESNGVLVVFFSRTGENYNVGVVDKGSTHVIADMIAEETGADVFEIQPVYPYPDTYEECTDIAKEEQNENARPEIIGSVDNFEQYDTVFIGYPIWWGDLPMIIYTFLESYDFSGKTIIPFCTNEGSGLAGTKSSIAASCPGSNVLDGLSIRGTVAQNSQDEAKSDVLKWLGGLGLDLSAS